MSAVQEKKTYQQSLLENFEKRSGEPEWLFKIRQDAYERFRSTGFPTRKNEAWKYIYLESLLQASWIPAADEKAVKNISSSSFGSALNEENRLVFINGVYQADRSQVSKVYQSLLATKLNDQGAWAQELLSPKASLEPNSFISVNTFQFRDGVFLRVPANTSIEKPLHLIFASEGDGRISYPRVLAAVEENSKINLVIHIQGSLSGRSLTNTVAEFKLGRNASVSCVVRQQEGPAASQFLNLKGNLAEGSRFEFLDYAAGGAIIRNESLFDLEGPDTFVSAAGLAVLSGNSQVFQHVHMNHTVPHCTSRQVYKNILAGKSVAEFNSMVHVWRGAKKSDSQQLDKNLLLSESARVYSRPQLKIDNDDVSANHGAATGQLDPKELFYLSSRGIRPDEARSLLIRGFAGQILESVKHSALRHEMEADMEARVRDILAEERKW